MAVCLGSLLVGCEREEPAREVPLSQLSRSGGLPPGMGEAQQQGTQPAGGPMAGQPNGGMAPGPAGAMGTSGSPSEMGAGTAAPAGDSGVAGISWRVPSSWQSRGPAPMRVATYSVPPAPGDSEPGELAVFYFGAGQGGDVTANLQRWYGQIEQPDGRPSAQVARVSEKTVNGVKVTTVAVSGTYLWSARPMSPDKVKKPNYRLLGAIAEAPEGNVFFKLTAPAKTAAASNFDAVVGSIHRS
jgi:hypothetical protein